MAASKSTALPDDVFLRLSGITKTFGKFEALKSVALDVRRGEMVVFLGPSGCGKTTLLRIIAGLEAQDNGAIVQDGREISRLPADSLVGALVSTVLSFGTTSCSSEGLSWSARS